MSLDLVYCFSVFKISIVGTVGNGYRGDIAIDDIVYKEGPCSTTTTATTTTTAPTTISQATFAPSNVSG